LKWQVYPVVMSIAAVIIREETRPYQGAQPGLSSSEPREFSLILQVKAARLLTCYSVTIDG
jgi:hypothetical protein